MNFGGYPKQKKKKKERAKYVHT